VGRVLAVRVHAPARRGETVTPRERAEQIARDFNYPDEDIDRIEMEIVEHGKAERRAAFEEAAKKCREVSRRLEANGDTGPAWGADDCEKAVRKLAGEEAAR
jgi:hypothetical protein